MTALSSTQLSFDFDPSLQQRYPTKLDYINYLILSHKDQKNVIAANLDMAPSTLARKLTQNGDQRFTLNDEEKLYAAYPDIARKAVSYDASKWCDTNEAKVQRLLGRIEDYLDEKEAIAPLISELKGMLK